MAFAISGSIASAARLAALALAGLPAGALRSTATPSCSPPLPSFDTWALIEFAFASIYATRGSW